MIGFGVIAITIYLATMGIINTFEINMKVDEIKNSVKEIEKKL